MVREPLFFTATKLQGTGKKGILKPDESGYYTMPIGGLNCLNSNNEYYMLDGAEHLFKNDSLFMRRVLAGNLFGELGHPRQEPGTTSKDYFHRVHEVRENNRSVHYRKIWLDPEFGRKYPQYNNPELVAIMAELCPAGVHGPALKAALDNPSMNVCFSVRSLTRNYIRAGRTYRVINNIVTFDQVTEPGIAHATKFDAPGLEAAGFRISEDMFQAAETGRVGFANEESYQIAMESMRLFREGYRVTNIPSILQKW